LTIVLPRSPIVPDEVTAGLDTVAIRMPAHPVARALLEAAALPVAAPSANLFSRPSPTRAQHVLEDLDGRIDLVLDGGSTAVGVESTVLDLTTEPPTVLRPGAVTIEMLRRVLPDVRQGESLTPSGSMKSPGLLDRHYSPRAPLTVYEGIPAAVAARIGRDAANCLALGRRVGLILAADDEISGAAGALVERLGPADNLELIAANLYNALRALDAASVDVIFARSFGTNDGLGAAIRDRLHRAAAGHIVSV
jgi:L-threonylcarbamoyladenylate synthase